MMYQHSLVLTYFTWHSSVTRLGRGGINGQEESGKFLEWREKIEEWRRRIRGKGESDKMTNKIGVKG